MADSQVKLAQEGFDWINNVIRHFVKGTPQGGMVSTASDLTKFTNAFTSGKLVSLEMVHLMSTPKPPAAPHWGYGMMMADAGGFGHGGGFLGINALALMYPDGYTVVALSNIDYGAYVALDKLYELADLKSETAAR